MNWHNYFREKHGIIFKKEKGGVLLGIDEKLTREIYKISEDRTFPHLAVSIIIKENQPQIEVEMNADVTYEELKKIYEIVTAKYPRFTKMYIFAYDPCPDDVCLLYLTFEPKQKRER